MSQGSEFGNQLARAMSRAEEKYPHQPERARKMADEEMGYNNGPYKLEPMTWTQRIAFLLGLSEHVTDFSDMPIMATQWQQFKSGFRFFFTGS